MSRLLKVVDVRREFWMGGSRLEVLRGISLEVRPGEILAILGPSGAGKSTLLHIMGFLDRPTAGDVWYGDDRLSALDGYRQARLRNRQFGFVFQLHHLLPELTVLENAVLPLMIRHSTLGWLGAAGASNRRARSLLERLGLGRRLGHRPNQLSVGERQRVAMARALAGDPEILFCDEPTGSLDPETSREMQKLIVELNRETKKTFVLVTHDPTVAALAERQVHLEDGRVADHSAATFGR